MPSAHQALKLPPGPVRSLATASSRLAGAGSQLKALRHRQRPHGARAEAGHQQQLSEIDWPAVRRGGQRAVQAARDDIGGTHVVMGRHHQIWQRRLRRRALRQGLASAPDAVGTKRAQSVELGLARCRGAAVGQVDDLALRQALDRGIQNGCAKRRSSSSWP